MNSKKISILLGIIVIALINVFNVTISMNGDISLESLKSHIAISESSSGGCKQMTETDYSDGCNVSSRYCTTDGNLSDCEQGTIYHDCDDPNDNYANVSTQDC